MGGSHPLMLSLEPCSEGLGLLSTIRTMNTTINMILDIELLQILEANDFSQWSLDVYIKHYSSILSQ